MKLLTQPITEQLLHNGQLSIECGEDGCAQPDFMPVVKLFTPDAHCTWLLTELDPQDEDIAFGLCDLGIGSPELGLVRISELACVRGRLGLPIERDLHFRADRTISAYAEDARACRAYELSFVGSLLNPDLALFELSPCRF